MIISYSSQYNMYTAFGLRIRSTIVIKELVTCSQIHEAPDVIINVEYAAFDRSMFRDQYVMVQDNKVYISIPKVAVYVIEAKRYITIYPDHDADEDRVRLFLLGSCMGILLMLNNVLPLHGSAVVIDGLAYAVVGDSGAGKSTLAAAFKKEGYRLLTDDVIAVHLHPETNTPIVHPSYPQQKLWQESLDYFGMESIQYKPLFQEMSKFAIPMSSHYEDKATKLAGIFELVKTEQDVVRVQHFNRLEALHIMLRHTYRNNLIPRLQLEHWHFEYAAALAGQIQCYQLQRPVLSYTAPNLVEEILNTLTRKEVGSI